MAAAATLRCARNGPARELFAGRRGACRLDSSRLAPRLSGPASHPPRWSQHPTKEKPREFQANVPTPHATPRRERCVCVSHHPDFQPMVWPAAFPDGKTIRWTPSRVQRLADKEGQPHGGLLSVQPLGQDLEGRTRCSGKITLASWADKRSQFEVRNRGPLVTLEHARTPSGYKLSNCSRL
jgi:hypothetical protein